MEKLPKPQKDKIKKKLKGIGIQLFQVSGIKPIVGDWKGYYRIRIGDTRLIFWIDRKQEIIYVDHIGPRGNIYK